MQLIGIDGCRAGWVAACSDETLASVSFAIVERLETLIAETEGGQTLIMIDIPIGLPENGARECDRAARRRLGAPRGSSVFAAPCRSALAATSYAEACGLNRRARNVAVSLELYNILPKIREADTVITPTRQAWIRESHPEVIFAVLAGGKPGLLSRKKTADGERERLDLLAGLLPRFDPVAERLRLGRAAVARDDIVDAAACLVAASRWMRGEAAVLPADAIEHDARGLRMEIVA